MNIHTMHICIHSYIHILYGLGSDQYGIFGVDINIREQEDSDVQYIGHYFTRIYIYIYIMLILYNIS